MTNVTMAAIAALTLAGCASPRYGDVPYDESPIEYGPSSVNISVDSNPRGARIEVDQDTIGATPCTISVPSGAARIFLRPMKIEAFPKENGYVQTKYFYGQDEIPKRIFFDMNLHYQPRGIDINLHDD